MAEWLITLQIQISIAVVAILLLRQAMKKTPKVYSYLLWLLVFVRLLVPVSVETRFSFMPSEQERDAFVAEVLENLGEENNLGSEQMHGVGINAEDILPQAGMSDTVGIQASGYVPGVQGSQVISPDDNSSTANGTFSNPVGEGTTGESIMEGVVGSGSMVAGVDSVSEHADFAVKSQVSMILLVVWGMGTAAVLGYNGLALVRMRKLLGKGESSQKVTVVNAVTGKKKNIPIYCCADLNTPFTLGLLKPAIYLPVGLNADEQEYILCHERVHISRKDNLVKHLAFLLTAIYWFNPFVWVAFFLMERDMEMSCDEKVLKIMGRDIKKNYSQSLLNFAEGRGKMPATHLTFGENSVKQRVKNVLSYKNAKKWSVGIGVVVLFVVVVALFTTGRNDMESDGPGNVVQDEESHDVQDGSGQELVDGQESPVQGGSDSDGLNGSDVQGGNATCVISDPIYVSETPQSALEGWMNRFAAQDEKIVASEYDYNEDTTEAVIRYVAEDGWKRYAYKEVVKVVATDSDDLYYVEQESLTEYRTFRTNEEFESFYGTPGLRDLNLLKYDASYYRRILQQFHEDGADAEYCKKFTDPVTAAVEQLNLGEGSGVARLKDGSFVSGGGTLGGVVPDGTVFDRTGSVQHGLNQDAYFTEGIYAYVTYTFAKDGSTVEFPIRLIEGSYGLWSVDANAVREGKIVQNYEWEPSIEQRFGFSLEVSQYGLYRDAGGVLTNIYPYYISTDRNWDEVDGVFYFATDTTYREGDPDYEENMICMLDLATGEIDKEALSLESMPLQSVGALRAVAVHDGYVYLGWENMNYYMPLINTGNTALATGYTYNGKPVKDLTEEERDVYGVELRNEILKNGEVVKLSNRTMTNTYAYVDLDGDGKTEKISLSAGTPSEDFTPRWTYDSFQLQVGDSVLIGELEYLKNELWFFSYDGENIATVLWGYGGGNNAGTIAAWIYIYKDGELCQVGDMYGSISDIVPSEGNGVFYLWEDYHNFMQPISLKMAWKINEFDQFERVSQETYDIRYGRATLPDLLVALPVHETPGSDKVTYIQPQKVDFIRFNSSFDWVYIEAADGTAGWFEIEVLKENSSVAVQIVDLEMKHWEVFILYYAG